MSRRKLKCSAKNVNKTAYKLNGGPFDSKTLFLSGVNTVTFGVGKFYGRYFIDYQNPSNIMKWEQLR